MKQFTDLPTIKVESKALFQNLFESKEEGGAGWINHSYELFKRDKKSVASYLRKIEPRFTDVDDDFLFECRHSYLTQLSQRQYPDYKELIILSNESSKDLAKEILEKDLPFSLIENEGIFYLGVHYWDSIDYREAYEVLVCQKVH